MARNNQPGERLGMGQLEAMIMDVLWDNGGPLTPGVVHERLIESHEVGYTTVLTVLTRLWQKGTVERERSGRAYAYQPIRSRDEETALRMKEVLAAAGDHASALGHFVAGLGKKDRAQLRALFRKSNN